MKNPLCNFASKEGGRETAFCAILPNQMQPSHFSALHSACTYQTSKSRELEGRWRSRAAFYSTTALPFLQTQPCTTPYFGLGQKSHPSPQAWVAHQPAYRSSPGRSRALGEAGCLLFLTDHISQDRSMPMRDQSCPKHQLAFPLPLVPGFMALTRCQHRTGHGTL